MAVLSPPPGFRPFTERAAMLRDFQSFVINPRPIQVALMPVNANAPPIVVLAADAALRDLVRLHIQDVAPGDGGDLVTDYRLMCDAQAGLAKLALRFQWSAPAVYRMTLVWRIPKHTRWLLAALKAGGAWCQAAPLDPYKPVIWLPIDSEELAPHVLGAAAVLAAVELKKKVA